MVKHRSAPRVRGQAEPPLVDVRDLRVAFRVRSGRVYAVNGVSFVIRPRETVAIVGESGSGKSATCRALLGLLPETAETSFGRLVLEGTEATTAEQTATSAGKRPVARGASRGGPRSGGTTAGAAIARARGRLFSLVAQDPVGALNPHVPVGDQIRGVLALHGTDDRTAREQAVDLLVEVGIGPERAGAYPGELSGGMCQRVSIALALASGSRLLVADEPTSSLDVTTQARIIALLTRLRDDRGMGLLLVTHDLLLARRVSDRILVMYGGLIVERGRADAVISRPVHPYTRGLLAAVPDLDEPPHLLRGIPGTAPVLHRGLTSCPFADRCDRAVQRCHNELPPEAGYAGGTIARCFVPAGVHAAAERDDHSRASRDRVQGGSVPIVRVESLSVRYPVRRGLLLGRTVGEIVALSDVSFELRPGEVLGVIGETGAGKSTLLRSLLRLEPDARGRIELDGRDISTLPEAEFRPLRESLQIVLQHPSGSIDPVYTAGGAAEEPLAHHGQRSRRERWARAVRALESCGLRLEVSTRRSEAFSGGQKQRIAIARSIADPPRLLLADEPVSSLDVSVQAGVLNLLADLVETFGFAMVFVSHDLAVVRVIADSVLVLRNGRVIEYGDAATFFASPHSAYGRSLLLAARGEAATEADDA